MNVQLSRLLLCLLCLMVLKQQPYALPPMRRCDTTRTIPQHYPRSEISELKVHCRCDLALLYPSLPSWQSCNPT